MTRIEAEGEEVLFGVSLTDLARVHAAPRAGVPADERLAELGLSRAGFARAEQAWLERLATSLRDDPGLFVAYDHALSEALAKDGPRLLPYEEELAAWVSLEGHLQRALDPAETAGKAGLTLAEVARLHGIWAERLAGDAELSGEARRLRAEEPPALVEVRREPRARRVASVFSETSEVRTSEAPGATTGLGGTAAPDAPAAAGAGAPAAAGGPAATGAPPSTPMSTGTGAIDLGALLKGPLPFDPGAAPRVGAGPAAGGGGAPGPRPAPTFTGTAAVDLSQLRAGPVPFGPVAPRPDAAAHSSNPPSRGPEAYTGTTDVNLRAILGAGGPLPFQKDGPPGPAPVPPGASGPPRATPAPGAGPAPPPPAAFTPPPALPGPAPATPPTVPPDKPRPFDSETTDVDPAMIAAILAKGAPPFRK